MKKMKKFFGTLAIMVMMLSLVMTVQAKDYTDPEQGGKPYKVRIFAGNQGTFEGGAEYKEYFGRVNFSRGEVKPIDESKYYVKGIKPSGADASNAESRFADASFIVTKDRDYVVIYGLLKDPVKYSVYYLDANGNELLPHEEFTANIGDKPIVGYRAVDGYIP